VPSVLGFTVKSGWASAIVLDGSTKAPGVVASQRLELSDPADAKSRQPYHSGRGTARKPGRELDTLIASVERFGLRSVDAFIREYEPDGWRFDGAGIVVGSLIDPTQIANDHIRIHALEGQLFRSIVKDAVERRRMTPLIWRERDLYGVATTRLKRSESDIREMIAGLGRTVEGPWRAEHKAAAVAAWLVMQK